MPVRQAERLQLSQQNNDDAPGDYLFQLGIMASSGRSGAADLLAAHMWFNLSARRGNHAAARIRSEIAAEMSPSDVAAAQRAARDWVTKH